MSGLAHESQCLKGVAKSAGTCRWEVGKISGAGLSEPVINSPPVARLFGRVKIAEVETPPKKKPCEALAPRDVWLFSLSLIVFTYMILTNLYLFLLSSILIFLISSSF